MAERWRSFFDSSGAFEDNWLRSAVTHWGFHESLYGMIQRLCNPGARILDVGCGPGWSGIYLSSLGYEVVGIDNEPTLVALAQRQSNQVGATTKFQVADAFDLSSLHGKFNLAYSCGVLEHFDRATTVNLLKEQAACATYVIIQIPTRYTAYTGRITDERIYTIRQLATMVHEAGMEVVAKFGYGELSFTKTQRCLRLLLPRAGWRLLQNLGYCYSIAVIGKSKRAH